MQVTKPCKTERNKWLSKIPEFPLRLNTRYYASYWKYPFATVLGFDGRLGLDTFPYPFHKHQPTTERHNAKSHVLTSAKASQAKQANLHGTLEPKHKVANKVLVSKNNINLKKCTTQDETSLDRTFHNAISIL